MEETSGRRHLGGIWEASGLLSVCGIMSVESWLWNPGSGILPVESLLWNPGCGIVSVESWLWNPGCGILAVVSLAEILAEDSRAEDLLSTQEAPGPGNQVWSEKVAPLSAKMQHVY